MSASRLPLCLLLSLCLRTVAVSSKLLGAGVPLSTTEAPSPIPRTCPRQVTATGAFFGNDLKKRDLWYICGYCCGVSTLSCNNGAYCKVTHLAGGAYGYCSTIMDKVNEVYTAVMDYTDWNTFCGSSTICCDKTSPYGFEYYFTDAGRTTRMFGCDTVGYTIEGTAAANFVTDTGISLYAAESTARSVIPVTSEYTPTPTTQYDTESPASSTGSPSESATSTQAASVTSADDGDNLQNASNLATIVGTAVGVPLGIISLVAAVYFSLKQGKKPKDDQAYSQIEMEGRHGSQSQVRLLR